MQSKGERETDNQLNAEFQRIAKSEKTAILDEQCKETEENSRRERLEIFSRKLEISKENIIQKWAQLRTEAIKT